MISLQQKPDLRTMLVEGGFSGGSIFPRLAHLLETSDESLDALLYVAKSKKVTSYDCLIDFYFCEFFPEFKTACFRYYKDRKKYPRLKDKVSKKQIEDFQDVLLWGITYARHTMGKKEKVTWSQFVGRAKRTHRDIHQSFEVLIKKT